jgi:hypothetical protein
MTGRGLRIHWAWLPAAIFVSAVSWHRYGIWWTLPLIGGGLVFGGWVNRRARRRRSRGARARGGRGEPAGGNVAHRR